MKLITVLCTTLVPLLGGCCHDLDHSDSERRITCLRIGGNGEWQSAGLPAVFECALPGGGMVRTVDPCGHAHVCWPRECS